MKKLVKGLVLVMVLAMSLSMTFGVGAADVKKMTSDGNTTELVTDFSQAGIQLQTQGSAKPEGFLNAKITDKGVELTAAANFNAAFASVMRVNMGGADPAGNSIAGIKYDWSGALALDTKVDASATTKDTQFLVGIMPTYGNDTKGFWTEMRAGSTVYLMADDDDVWTAVTVSGKRTITLPAGFKGVVRMSLDGMDLGGGPWSDKNEAVIADTLADKGTNMADSLKRVSTVYFSYSGDTQPLYVNSISIVKYGEGTPMTEATTTTTKAPTTTAKPTTTKPTTTTTKAPTTTVATTVAGGDVAGDVAPVEEDDGSVLPIVIGVVAAVVVIGGVAAFVIIKKKKA